MIKIAVMDDEKIFRDMIARTARLALREETEEIRITDFADAEAFLDAVRGKESFDILLADIRMDGMNGMELGRRMRALDPGIFLVFITSFEEYAAESYRIEAHQYILKQDIDRRLPDVLREIVRGISSGKKDFCIVRSGTEKVKLYYDDIIYLYKSKGAKYVNYVTENGIYRERISLEAARAQLNSSLFIPAGRGYVVNMRRIRKIRQDTLYLEKGYEVQVSRAKLPEVKQQISKCWKEI